MMLKMSVAREPKGISTEELRANLVSIMHRMSRLADHPGWCAYSDNLEDKCDCIVSELIEVVRGGQ